MKDRRQIARELDNFQTRMKELEIHYEQYFAGVEKREPYQERKELSRQIRQYKIAFITQTDLKFRYHGLTSRLASYGQYWDRILRLIDEGKYHRHLAKTARNSPPPPQNTQPSPVTEEDQIYKDLAKIRKECGMEGDAPSPDKIASFLAAQREKISQKFGDRPVEFLVEINEGKPRIKARLKQ
ncbi:MAG TPA: MXAN_5187 C-terminal domain-containing protein [Geopsychrobacteraceae bacterium]|nr:MXAN_5187 C-terminal domain-containing protein [Geopsychrobacteraceae bacterium]